MADPAVLDIEALHFGYPQGGFSLDIDRLRIESGGHTAVVGPSGCGKTTLLSLMTGIRVPHRGTVRLGDVIVSAQPEAERRRQRVQSIGMIFQDFALLDYLSVLENIVLPYHISPALRMSPAVQQRARDLGRAVGIDGLLDRPPARLSHGERQRAAVCRALITRPRLLACDEPTGSLDPTGVTRIIDLLFAQAAEHQATLVVVTHNRDIVARFEQVIDLTHRYQRATP